jgi:phosphatidate cytidylyltransferase
MIILIEKGNLVHLLPKFIDLKDRLLSSIFIFIFIFIFFKVNMFISSLFILIIYGFLLFEWHDCTRKNKKKIDMIFFLFITLGIIAFLGINFLRFLKFELAHLPIFLVILVTVVTDTSAYFIGRIIGNTCIFPKISPKKTLSGYIGGLLLGGLSPLLLFFIHSDGVTLYKFLGLILIGLFLSISVLAGDLFESYFKRCNKIKDTSNFLPGHGGFLDRLDGLLAASIALFLIIILSCFVF